MTDAIIYAWREKQGDVWTGEWALGRADKWVPAEANKYILATPEALAASPEGSMLLAEALLAQRAQIEADHAALIREAEARGMERALGIMETAGDSAVTEALGQRLCCNGQYCGCHGATVEEYLEHLIRAEAAAIRKEGALTKVARLGQEWDADIEARATKAHEKEIAVWSENYAALERERDKWFEGAGAHHVASMQQAQRADRAEAALSAAQQRIKLLCDDDEWNLGLQEALEAIRSEAAAIREMKP